MMRMHRDALIDAQRVLHHPLSAEQRARPGPAGFPHRAPQRVILQQRDDRLRHGLVIARRHEKAGLSVYHHLRDAARLGGDDRFAGRHRVDEGGAKPFGHRAHDENVESLVKREHVGPEAREQHVLFEMVVLDLALERGSQFAFTRDDEPRVRYLRQHQPRGLDQMALSLVRHERGHVADDRRLVRQPEILVEVRRRGGLDASEIDAFVDGDRRGPRAPRRRRASRG